MISNKQGFTLVEILIALALGAIILASVYSAFQVQQKSAVVQDQVVAMQDNLRAAMDIMTREIRMAGYDPEDGGIPKIETANSGEIRFTMDLEENGDVADSGEDITYSLYTTDGIQKLGRKNATLNQPVAEHIEALEFNYVLADTTETTAPGAGDLPNIRAVEISILARAERPDPDFTNTLTYTTGSGAVWGAYDDNYRRRLLIKTVRCRNMGM